MLRVTLGCLAVQALQPGEASSEEEDEGQLQEERPTSGSSKLAYTQEQANLRSSFLQVCTQLHASYTAVPKQNLRNPSIEIFALRASADSACPGGQFEIFRSGSVSLIPGLLSCQKHAFPDIH